MGNMIREITAESREARHTFTIYGEDGQRKQGLRLAFVKVLDIDCCDEFVTTEAGSRFYLYMEDSLREEFKSHPIVKCIVSFQAYKDGEYFAVARLYDANKINPVVDSK